MISIIRTILPESGDILRAKVKIHHFPGDILQIVPEADAVVGGAILWNSGFTASKD